MIYILGDVYNVIPNLDLPINDRVWSLKCPPSQKSSYNADINKSVVPVYMTDACLKHNFLH